MLGFRSRVEHGMDGRGGRMIKMLVSGRGSLNDEAFFKFGWL